MDEIKKQFEEYQKQIDGLTVALGKTFCGARLFCTQNDLIDCANCKGGQVAYKNAATTLYKQGVRILSNDEIKAIKPENRNAAQAMENKALRQRLKKSEHDLERYKKRIKAQETKQSAAYTKTTENLIDYLLTGFTGMRCEACVMKKRRAINGVCPSLEAHGVKACREGMIKYFGGSND